MEVERLTAVLETSGLASYRANMAAADRYTASTRDKLGALAEVSRVATDALAHVKMATAQAAESEAVANRITSSVSAVTRTAADAADHLQRVKMKSSQAAETTVVADQIDRKLKDVTGNANEARRAMEGVRLAGALGGVFDPSAGRFRGSGGRFVPGGGGGGFGGNSNPGVGGFGFGSGYGRIGLLGAGIGAGVLAGPAAGPAALGLLAGIPGLAATGAGALGTLMLAFNGVGKAIGGDKKAYDSLTASQQQFVLTVRSLDGAFDKLKQTAGNALFPGLTAGLKSALSPGTMGAITQAVTEFGHAIGGAGEQWGKYFGSSEFQSIFGPLMAAGAKNLGVISDTALHLADALGVLARAAIPLVDWMVKGADAGARWVDSFAHAKDATGGLSRAMNEAKDSLRLVGDLFGALAKAVYELGAALYPVSKVAVKDLTDALSFLAGWFQKNRQEIRDFVGGALAALVSTVRAAWPIVGLLAKALKDVADSIGGWKTAFEIVIGGLLLSRLGLLQKAIKGIGVALFAIPAEAKTAQLLIDGELVTIGTTAEVTAGKLYGVRAALLSLGGGSVLTALGAVAAALGGVLASSGSAPNVAGLPTGTSHTSQLAMLATGGKIPGSAASQAAKQAGIDPNMPFGNALKNPAFVQDLYAWATKKKLIAEYGPSLFSSTTRKGGLYQTMAANAASQYGVPQSMFLAQINQESGFSPTARSKAGALGIAQFMPGTAKGYGINPMDPNQALPAAAKMMASLHAKYGDWGLALAAYNAGSGTVDKYLAGKGALPAETVAYVKSITGSPVTGGYGSQPSPWGADPPFNKNLGPKPKKPPLIPVAMTNAASMYANLAKNLSNTGGQAKKYLDNELIVLTKEDNLLRAKLNSATGRNKDAIEKAMTGVENHMRDVGTLIGNAIVKTGAALLPDKLKAKLKSLQAQGTADADYGAVFVGAAAENYAKTIRDNLLNQSRVLGTEVQNLKGQLANANTKQRAAIKTEIATVTTQLKGVQDQVVQSLQGTVQALQSRVQGYFASVQQEIEAALGTQFFQNGGKTPLEQQLADMQASDQLGSLKDALQAAKDQLANDQSTLAAVIFDAATGSTSYAYNKAQQDQLDLDNKAVTAAQRQLDEYDLSIRAAQERTQVDQDYTVQARKLDAQLTALGDQFANGTGSMAALNDIAAQYGIQLSGTTIPDLDNLSVASKALVQAMGDLAAYIAKITGKTPAPAPTGPAPGAPDFGSSTGGGSALVDYAQSAQAAAEAMGSAGTYTVSGGSVYYQSNTGTYGKKPMLDEGGWVEKTGLAVVHAGETYSGVGSHRLGGSQMTVELHVHTLDPAAVDWDSVAPKVRDAFVRMAKAGAQDPWA